MRKRILAKEWLLFLGLLAIGLVVGPTIVSLIVTGKIETAGFYKSLVDESDWSSAWLFGLSPYLLVQLIRSVIWAVKTARSNDGK